MLQVRNVLCDILNYAYPKNDKLEKFKKFYVEMSNKNLKSKHGDYTLKTHHIRVFNLYRDDAAIIATTIHELAHHVDYVSRGTTNHDKEFYDVFKILLYAALDMKIFDTKDFLSANKDAADSNKIAKMISYYKPKETNYKKNKQKIIVKNCYDIKDKLSKNDFKFNGVNKTWEKEVDKDNVENELLILSNSSATYEIIDANVISFDKKRYMYVKNGSYEIKDELSKMNFTWDGKRKVWKKEYNKEELMKCKQKWPSIYFYTD